MRIALSSAVQHSLAYIQPKGSNISNPLRAWMCSGKSNKQLVDNLAAVSTYVWLRYVHVYIFYIICYISYVKCWLRHERAYSMFLLYNI